GHGDAGQTVKFLGVLNQVFSQPELVVAFDPGDARARQRAPEAPQNAFADFDFALEVFAAARREVVARNLPEVLEVAVQDQPVGTLAAEEYFEKQKRPFVVKGNLEIVGDDGQLIGGNFRPMSHQFSAWQRDGERRGGRVFQI